MKYLTHITLLVCLQNAASADLVTEAETEKRTVPVIVVTGTQTPKLFDESPVPIVRVDADEISETGAVRLDDILKTIPGLQLSEQHGQQGQSIMMQGMSSDHVLILIDGIPIKQTGSDINVERINLSNVSHIEIVPGSASALYGSSAMGGVINLITTSEEDPYTQAEIGLSQTELDTEERPTLLNVSVQNGTAVGSTFLNSNVNITRYSGVNLDKETYEEQIAGGYRWNVNETLTLDHWQASLTWVGGLLDRPYLQQRGPSTFERIKYENSHEISASLKRSTDISEQTLQLDFDNYETIQDLVATDNDDDFVRQARAYSGRASHSSHKTLGNHELTWGLVGTADYLNQDKEEDGIKVIEVDGTTRVSAEAFVQEDWTVLPTLETLLGFRSQWDSGFGLFASPKITIRWDAWEGDYGDLFVRASTGLGYRVPDLKQRYFEFDHSQFGYEVIGNSALEPETSHSSQIEVGGNIAVGSELLSWSSNVFHQNVSNLIEYELDETVVNGLDTFTHVNLGQAVIKGIDVKAALPLTIGHASITHEASYQLLSAQDTQTNLTLNGRPRYQAKLTQRIALGIPTAPVLTTQFRIQGEQFTDSTVDEKAAGFSVIDTSFQWNLTPHWQLKMGIDNLTNNYNSNETTDVRPTLGRTWKLALRYQTQEK